MIELEKINVSYGKNRVLKDVSLHVAAGEVVALIGANAVGKTTTLRTAMGLKVPDSGAVRFAGIDITRLSTHQRVDLGLVLVPEGRQVFADFTVFENLQMGAYHRPDRDRLGAEFEHVFELFPRLADRRTQKAGSMSGGEQQMLAIARGYMAKPRCLLLDEPTLGLAPIMVDEITRIIGDLAAGGMTIVLSEQNAGMALGAATRGFALESGVISREGSSAELQADGALASLFFGV